MKFGNESQIGLIAGEVGGAVGAAKPEEQIELFNALIDGCRDAVESGSTDPKVFLDYIKHEFLLLLKMNCNLVIPGVLVVDKSLNNFSRDLC